MSKPRYTVHTARTVAGNLTVKPASLIHCLSRNEANFWDQ